MAVTGPIVTTSLQHVSGDGASINVSHAAATSDAIVAIVVMLGTGQSVSSATWNPGAGQIALAPIGAFNMTTGGFGDARIEAWGAVGTISATHNANITLSGANAAWDIVILSYAGTNQGGGTNTFNGFTSITNTDGQNSLTRTITTGQTGDMVQDATVSLNNNGNTTGTDWQDNSGSTNTQGKHYAGGASVVATETWDINANHDQYGMLAFNIAAGGSTIPITVNNLPTDSLAGGEIV